MCACVHKADGNTNQSTTKNSSKNNNNKITLSHAACLFSVYLQLLFRYFSYTLATIAVVVYVVLVVAHVVCGSSVLCAALH